MKKLLLILMLVIASPAFAASQWYQGSNTAPLQGTDLISDIDTNTKNYAFDPLDRLMTNYREGQLITYSSASALTVSAGQIVVADSAGTTKLMLSNASDTAVTWADIDAGAEAVSTTYYVWAIAASSSATAVTYKISLSATAPTGATYYKKLGSFYNNASGDIGVISNDNDKKKFGDHASKTVGTTYQAQTDGFVVAYQVAAGATSGSIATYSDSAAAPTVICALETVDYNTFSIYASTTCPVKAGDYYKVVKSDSVGTTTASMFFIPIN